MLEDHNEEILISFLNVKEKYRKLAKHIVQLIQDDPLTPKESLHTIIFRIKKELRLIEKINGMNNNLETGERSITVEDYQTRIPDLLGVRIICLRLSDVQKVELYLKLLSEEHILKFVKDPERRRSFILPVQPGVALPDGISLSYSGYSSIHYQVELGENSDAPEEMIGVVFELQLRTILEEAWSEIDHKYRYVRSRIGTNLPNHINTGFYNLSAYLQVAALQAENLCCMAEVYNQEKSVKDKEIDQIAVGDELSSTDFEKDKAEKKLSSSEIEKILKNILGFKVSLRTLIYIEKRLEDFNSDEKSHRLLKKLLNKTRVVEFSTIYKEILNDEPLVNAKEGNLDLINVLNYAIFYNLQGKRVAQEGLKAVLKWRKGRSTC
jgi:ppGpp synthetase/RelA/SpoT-type nucleotidyltranferase